MSTGNAQADIVTYCGWYKSEGYNGHVGGVKVCIALHKSASLVHRIVYVRSPGRLTSTALCIIIQK